MMYIPRMSFGRKIGESQSNREIPRRRPNLHSCRALKHPTSNWKSNVSVSNFGFGRFDAHWRACFRWHLETAFPAG